MNAVKRAELSERAQQLIKSGALVCGEHRTFAGSGEEHTCSLCGETIKKTEIGYEVEVRQNWQRWAAHFHMTCESIWRAECQRR